MPVITQHCVQPCSAQLADLKALTVACQLANGHKANIFTNSVYAHGMSFIWSSMETKRFQKE